MSARKKFNLHYGLPITATHSIESLSVYTGIPTEAIQMVHHRAYQRNTETNKVKNPESKLYGFLLRDPKILILYADICEAFGITR